MSTPQPPLHIPLALVWTMLFALGSLSWWLGGEIRVLQEWRETTQENRFTSKDAAAMRENLTGLIRDERAFARSICNELRRLQQELGKVPSNDCGRP